MRGGGGKVRGEGGIAPAKRSVTPTIEDCGDGVDVCDVEIACNCLIIAWRNWFRPLGCGSGCSSSCCCCCCCCCCGCADSDPSPPITHSSLSRRVSQGLARAAAMTDKKAATPAPPTTQHNTKQSRGWVSRKLASDVRLRCVRVS